MVASRFMFVPGAWTGGERAIACDGLVPGSDLDLSHWQGNRTPTRFKRDTSAEIALAFVASPASEPWRGAVAVNNHFDTDGVLSAWTLLHPREALARRGLLVSAAEAGDFDEWPADRRGLWVDAALRAMGSEARGEAGAYERCLSSLPDLLDHIESRAELWQDEWDEIQRARAAVDADELQLRRIGSLGLIVHPPGWSEIPGPVFSRVLPGCRRYLMAFARTDGRLTYLYELPRHAWAETLVRPLVRRPDTRRLADRLGGDWTAVGLPPLTGLVRTLRPVRTSPEAVATTLMGLDEGLTAPALHA